VLLLKGLKTHSGDYTKKERQSELVCATNVASQPYQTATSGVKLKASVEEMERLIKDLDERISDLQCFLQDQEATAAATATSRPTQKLKDDEMEEYSCFAEQVYKLIRRPATKVLIFMLSDSLRTFSRECAFYLIDDAFSTADGRRLYSEVAAVVDTCIDNERKEKNISPGSRPLLLWLDLCSSPSFRYQCNNWQSFALQDTEGDPKTRFQLYRHFFKDAMEELKGKRIEIIRKEGKELLSQMDISEDHLVSMVARFGKKKIAPSNNRPVEGDPPSHGCLDDATKQSSKKRKGRVEVGDCLMIQDDAAFKGAVTASTKARVLLDFSPNAKQISMLASLLARQALLNCPWEDFVRIELCAITGQLIFEFEDGGHFVNEAFSIDDFELDRGWSNLLRELHGKRMDKGFRKISSAFDKATS